jgi:hypothetical protein
MHQLTQDFAIRLANVNPPCISIYQPTHRRHPENQQDPIRFRNLVKEAESSLLQKHSAADVAKLLAPLDELSGNADFWNHTLEGLTVFAAPGVLEIFQTQRTVMEFAVVADNFHVKPLRRILQTSGYFQVLCLSEHEIKLYEGNRNVLDEVDLAREVPRMVRQALGDGRLDEEKYFRAVDKAILEHHSRPSDLPLIIAALPENQGIFRPLTQNPFVIEAGIPINPFALSADELRVAAWKLVEPVHHARTTALCDEFAQASLKGLGSDHLATVAEAAATGKVKVLLLEADRHLPGRLDPVTGQIESGRICDPRVDDMLDDLGELVLDKGGKLYVVPSEWMPTTTGLAAIYRY